jgi:hypothetical protein
MWSESDPEVFQQFPYEEIKCVEIHMPEDRFRALLEHDEWLYNSRISNHMVGGFLNDAHGTDFDCNCE